MIDIRYHVYSLAAVFFALAVGIVFGTTFARTSPASQAERRTIQRYENSMRLLKREIERATEGAARNERIAKSSEEFCKAVLPIVAKDRMFWRNVAIVQTGDYDALTGSVKQALELAGAHVATVTTINRAFDFGKPDLVAHALRNCGITPPTDADQARDKLLNVIANTVVSGVHPDLLPYLQQSGVASFKGEYTRYGKLRFVVIVGGSVCQTTNTASNVDGRLLNRFEDIGITVVGCEPSDAGSSYIPVWHKFGISTVDNAESAVGQVALLCALNGEKAAFGTKETADRLVPLTLEKK